MADSAIIKLMANGTKKTLKEIESAIAKLSPADQARLLGNLPSLVSEHSLDQGLLKLAEPSFRFWDNADDAAYDSL